MEMQRIKDLAQALSGCQKISEFDCEPDSEAWAIAHGLSDIEESIASIIEKIVPDIVSKSQRGESIEGLLVDILDNLRHIVYHIRDSKYFKFILDEKWGDGNSSNQPQ